MPDETPLTQTQGIAQSRYELLSEDREIYLNRARDCAKYTIPSLIPPAGNSKSTEYPTPYQSLGARGVNHLAGKLLMGLLPSNTPFFRLLPSDSVLESANPPLTDQVKQALEKTLTHVEGIILRSLDTRGLRVHAFEMFKHLIVGGNCLLGITKNATRVFPLHQYAVNRDPEGTVLEIVIKECVAPVALPDEIREAVQGKLRQSSGGTATKTVDVFTYIERQERGWTSYQEVLGIKVPGSEAKYPLERLPYLPLRWTRIDGESYGRGHCEEYLGDMISYEGLAQAIVEGAASAAKVLWAVKPGSLTDPRDLEKGNNSIIPGDAEDVTCIKQDKVADFTFVSNTAQAIEQRLSYAFLLNSAIQRNAERVTAEEIRFVANELETALGGVYSIFAEEFQRPLVIVLLAQGQKDKSIPQFPPKAVHPTIVTGVDALGRSQQFNRLTSVVSALSALLGPQALAPYLNIGAMFEAGCESEGVEYAGMVKSEEQVQQERQAMQMQSLAEKAAPQAVAAYGKSSLANQTAQQEAVK